MKKRACTLKHPWSNLQRKIMLMFH